MDFDLTSPYNEDCDSVSKAIDDIELQGGFTNTPECLEKMDQVMFRKGGQE